MSSTKVTSNKLALLAVTIVSASLLILINQGKTYQTRTPSTLTSYIDYFEEMFGVRYKGDIIFVEHHFFKDVTEERSGGLCVQRWFGKNTIYIDQALALGAQPSLGFSATMPRLNTPNFCGSSTLAPAKATGVNSGCNWLTKSRIMKADGSNRISGSSSKLRSRQ